MRFVYVMRVSQREKTNGALTSGANRKNVYGGTSPKT